MEQTENQQCPEVLEQEQVEVKKERVPITWLVTYALLAILLAGCSLLIVGYREGPQVNHEQQWTVIYKFQDPDLFLNDPIIEAFAKAPTLFFKALGKYTTYDSLPGTLFLLHILSQIGTISALMFGALPLARIHRWAPILCGILFCGLSDPLAGASPLHLWYVTHATVAAPFALWALATMMNGWWAAAFTLAGITTCIHPLLGICVWIATFGAALIVGRKISKRNIAFWILSILPGLALAAIVIVPGIKESMGAKPLHDTWMLWLMDLYPIHYKPFSTSWFFTARLASAIIFLIAFGGGFLQIRPAVCFLVAWIVAGIIGTEIIRMGLFVQLQTARAATLFIPLLIWAGVGELTRLKNREHQPIEAILFGGILIHAFFFQALRQQAGGILLLFIVNFTVLIFLQFYGYYGKAFEKLKSSSATIQNIAALTVLLISLSPVVLSLASFTSLAPWYMVHIKGVAIHIICAEFYIAVIVAGVLIGVLGKSVEAIRKLTMHWNCVKRWSAIATVMLIAIVFFQVQLRNNREGALLIIKKDDPWEKSAAWIRENTEKTDHFLVYFPRKIKDNVDTGDYSFFRVRTQRSAVHRRSDYRALYINPSLVTQFKNLQKDLKVEGRLKAGVQQEWLLWEWDIIKKAKNLDTDYLVVPAVQKFKLKPVYEDELVKIYKKPYFNKPDRSSFLRFGR